MAKIGVYKYVRTGKGWRYCKAAFAANWKIVQDMVIVDGRKETHEEGAYYLLINGQWVKTGDNAQDAANQQKKRLAQHQYEKATGEAFPQPETGELLADAAEAFLADLELKVASRARRPKTLEASRLAITEFVTQCGLKRVTDVTDAAITRHMAWCVENSPTNSARTAANKFLLILQFLKHTGHVPAVREGKTSRPLGLKDAPKFTESEVEIYTPEELAKFFFICTSRENAIFATFLHSGLREQELATPRPKDCILDGPTPCLKVVERPEYNFIPKAYQIRDVLIDPGLAMTLREWLKAHNSVLVFPSEFGGVDGHLLRLCKRVAKRAGLDPAASYLHKFRASFACHCLHRGMDIETLREQMGHRDTESLMRYIKALRKPERAEKVAQIWAEPPEVQGIATTAMAQ
jgi:integrase